MEDKKTNKHHVIPKHSGGAGLSYNRMELDIDIHKKVHYLDDKVDEELVKKDEYYYLIIIGAAYKCMEK